MSATSLDLSDKGELAEIAAALRVIARVADRLKLRWYVVGAVARDLLLWYGHGIATTRATDDVDIGVQVESWSEYEELSNALRNDSAVQETNVRHTFIFHKATEVDVVPFGALARDGQLFWPDDGRTMSVVGFDEAYEFAIEVRFRDNVHVRVASIPGLLLLKIVAWEDRHHEFRQHDAPDIRELLLSYSSGGNLERLYESADDLLSHFKYDPELAGAALLGRDVAAIMRPHTKEKVATILLRETNPDGNLSLAVDMQREVEGNLRLLEALVYGSGIERPPNP